MKVGEWNVRVKNVSWEDDYQVKIEGTDQEGDDVEFYVDLENHSMDAYVVRKDSLWDDDWTLSKGEERAVLMYVEEVLNDESVVES